MQSSDILDFPMIRTVLLQVLYFVAYGENLDRVHLVKNEDELRTVLKNIQNGSTVRMAPGEYYGGYEVRNISDLTIEAADSSRSPWIQGGAYAFHFSGCRNLTVRSLNFRGQTGNGINVDEGGVEMEMCTGVRLEKLRIEDIGPEGNHDAIKCSGLKDFQINQCRLSGWGGQGIDCVGCHDGQISECEFIGKQGFSASAAIQTKGGSQRIQIDRCRFKDAGQRALNLGGSTGKPFFRPQGALWEASEITVRRNRIEGSMCAVAFVGVRNALFEENTILFPTKWIFRSLQENRDSGFSGSQSVSVSRNVIVFRRSEIQTEINVGSGASLEQLSFSRNKWYAEDQPSRSKPSMNIREMGGSYGVDPRKALETP
jgi:hypothetical protein